MAWVEEPHDPPLTLLFLLSLAPLHPCSLPSLAYHITENDKNTDARDNAERHKPLIDRRVLLPSRLVLPLIVHFSTALYPPLRLRHHRHLHQNFHRRHTSQHRRHCPPIVIKICVSGYRQWTTHCMERYRMLLPSWTDFRRIGWGPMIHQNCGVALVRMHVGIFAGSIIELTGNMACLGLDYRHARDRAHADWAEPKWIRTWGSSMERSLVNERTNV